MHNHEPQFDSIVVLQDESGADHEFELLDLIELNGVAYAVFLPICPEDDEESSEVVILQVEGFFENNEIESFACVEDETVLYEIFEAFKKRHGDVFCFID